MRGAINKSFFPDVDLCVRKHVQNARSDQQILPLGADLYVKIHAEMREAINKSCFLGADLCVRKHVQNARSDQQIFFCSHYQPLPIFHPITWDAARILLHEL